MRIDLHNHTPLCQHATGTPEEYIQKAIALGIDVYGFSCHAPMAFDTKYRMSLAQLPEYFETLQSLRQSYKTHIDIRIGLEVDFIKGKENLIESQVQNAQVDYLIGSVHFLNDWGFDNPEFIGHYKHTDMTQCWSDYLDSIAAMAQSGLFQIIGHFDLLKVFNNPPPSTLHHKLKTTLESIKDNTCVLEINSAGLRKPCAEQYPSRHILKMAKDMQIPITFSSDAHSLEQVGAGYEICKNLALELGYTHMCAFKDKQIETFALT